MPTNILFLLNIRSSAPPGLLASETLCGYQGSLAGADVGPGSSGQ